MPNLQVLRIRHDHSAHPNKQLNLCLCEHTQWTDQCDQPVGCVCPLVDQLRPQHVIFGDITTGVKGEAIGLWQSPLPSGYEDDLDWPESVQRVTLIAGMYTGRAYGFSKDNMKNGEPAEHIPSTRSFLARLPNTIQRLTVVLASWSGGWDSNGKSIEFTEVPNCWDDDISMEARQEGLGLACSGLAKQMEIVGLETLSRDDDRQSIKGTRHEIERMMSSWEWSGRDARERSQKVSFTKGYLYGRQDVEGKTIEARRACQTVKRALLSDIILALDKYSCGGDGEEYRSVAAEDPSGWFDDQEW